MLLLIVLFPKKKTMLLMTMLFLVLLLLLALLLIALFPKKKMMLLLTLLLKTRLWKTRPLKTLWLLKKLLLLKELLWLRLNTKFDWLVLASIHHHFQSSCNSFLFLFQDPIYKIHSIWILDMYQSISIPIVANFV